MTRASEAIIDLDALAHNLAVVRAQVGEQVDILGVVKADAYGHGAAVVSRELMRQGAFGLGVARVEEGLELRETGIQAPILVLGGIFPEQAPQTVAGDLEVVVWSLPVVRALGAAARAAGKRARIHIKVDTGMGRLGLLPDQVVPAAVQMAREPGVKIAGVLTHLACADDPDKSYTEHQVSLFQKTADAVRAQGIRIPRRHAANSAAVLDGPRGCFEMVRPGIMLYGSYPSPQMIQRIPLCPVMTWKTRVLHLQDLPAGSDISYGGTFRTERPSRIATLPVGYADGFNRLLSNRWNVLVRGKKAPLVGRVCMDLIMIDGTDIPGIQVEDEVVLLGRQGDQKISAEDWARALNTIPYEIYCCVSKRVPRVYTGGVEPAKPRGAKPRRQRASTGTRGK